MEIGSMSYSATPNGYGASVLCKGPIKIHTTTDEYLQVLGAFLWLFIVEA